MARKVIRKRKVSANSVLGITKAKRSIAKATGIPTTKAGRKRKVLNSVTGGAYGKYTRTRAKVNRPYKTAKQVLSGKPVYKTGCTGCLISALGFVACIVLLIVGLVCAFV